MADIKITALPALAATADVLDVLAIVDVSDNGVIASGTTKSVLISELPYLANGSNISLLTNDAGYKTVSDFSNNGEAATANRDIGNTDAFGLSLITSGLGRINILSGGNVGIGESSPTAKLEVAGNVKVASASDSEIGGVAANGRMKVSGGLSYMQIQNANLSGIANHAMTQDSTGTTTLNSSATKTILIRIGNTSKMTVATSLITNLVATDFANYVRVTGDGGAMSIGQTTDINTAFLVKSNRATILNIGSVSTTFLSMLSSGNVGIGTATPTEKLDVVGNAIIGGNLTVNSAAAISTFSSTDSPTLLQIGKIGGFDRMSLNSITGGFDCIGLQHAFTANTNSAAGFQFNSSTSGNVNTLIHDHTGTATIKHLLTLRDGGSNKFELLSQAGGNSTFRMFDAAGVVQHGLYAGVSDNFLVANASQLGIGTTAPTEKLEVAGNVKVGGTLAVNQATGVSTFTGTGASDTRIDLHNASTASLVRLRFGSSGGGINASIAYNGATAGIIGAFYQNSLYTSATSGVKRIEATTGGYFIVTDNAALSAPVTRLEMNTSGRFGFGTTPDALILASVGGSIKVDGMVQLLEFASIATPPTNYGRVYAKTDGKVYYKNDAGTDYNLTNDGLSHVEVINAKTFTWTNGLLVSVV